MILQHNNIILNNNNCQDIFIIQKQDGEHKNNDVSKVIYNIR